MSLLDLLRAGSVAAFNAQRPTRTTLDFFAADLANLALRGVDLSGANLEKADFSGSDMTGANFSRANLAGADFTEATLDDCRLSKARMREAFLGDARAVGADFSGADLGEADLTGINARNANFAGARLKDAVLQNAHLIEANLTDARVGDGDLRGADLGMARLCGADLHGANLGGARLAGANLSGARMARATLRSADLTDASLANADLSGADLSGSTLSGADFTGADLFDAQVDPDALRGTKGAQPRTEPAPEEIELRVEDPTVAAGNTHVAILWENADGEDVLTLRVAVVARGQEWDGAASALGVSGDAVIARSLVAVAEGFVAFLFLDRGGACDLQAVRIGAKGDRTIEPLLRLDYSPAITPLVATEGGRVFVYGLGRQGTLSSHEWTGDALVEQLCAPAGPWRGFCSRHEPILLGKGATLARVRPDGIGPIRSAPAGFPGRLQAAAPDGATEDALALVWTQRDEQGFHLAVGDADPEHMFTGSDIGGLDLIHTPSGVLAAWMCEDDENIPMFLRLPGGSPTRILTEAQVLDLEDIRFVHSLTGGAVALTTMNGDCIVVDLTTAPVQILAMVCP